MVNVNWPTAVAGIADNVSSLSASACHIGGPIDVNPGELTLVYGTQTKGCRTNIKCQTSPTIIIVRLDWRLRIISYQLDE